MTPVLIPDHVTRGLALLIEQYKGKPVISALLSSYLKQVQEVENATWEVIVTRDIAVATGIRLDYWAKIVNVARDGRGDEELRWLILLQIRVNRSLGEVLDIYEIARLALGSHPFVYESLPPGRFRVKAFDIPSYVAKALIPALTKAAPVGVSAHLEYSDNPGWWEYGSVYSPLYPSPGYGSVTDPSSGGVYPYYPDPVSLFTYGSTYDATQGQLGYGSTRAASAGGMIASLQKG